MDDAFLVGANCSGLRTGVRTNLPGSGAIATVPPWPPPEGNGGAVCHPGDVAGVDLVDESFIAAPPAVLAPIVADPERWPLWWPDLQLAVFMDRGLQGLRWSVTGAFVGSVELWLEAFRDGTIVHYYLRGLPTAEDPTKGEELPDTPAGWRRAARLREARAFQWKRLAWSLKDEVEGDRPAGCPTTSVAPAQESDRAT